MSCPTCGHTIHLVYQDKFRTIRHCPRCGTRTNEYPASLAGDETRPALVDRCRRFEPALRLDRLADRLQRWHAFGIREAIHPPEARGDVDASDLDAAAADLAGQAADVEAAAMILDEPRRGDRRVERARDLLVAAIRDHQATCTKGAACPEIGGILGYLAHCLGARAADLLQMNRSLLDYDLNCPGGVDHIHKPPEA